MRIPGHCEHLASAERSFNVGGAVGEEEFETGNNQELERWKEECEIFGLLIVVAPGKCRLNYPMQNII